VDKRGGAMANENKNVEDMGRKENVDPKKTNRIGEKEKFREL
jgi:hypothetical protein